MLFLIQFPLDRLFPGYAPVRISDLTVVVPTKNEAHNIVAFLQSLHPDVALIIVDASEDNTREIVDELRPQARVIVSAARIALAREIGARAARTPWVLFSDADVSFAPDYWQRLGAVEADGVDVLYGLKLSQTGHQRYYRRFAWWMHTFDRLGIPAASGSNLLISRRALQACGGFDPELTCNEDSEIVWRIQRKGYGVRFYPELVVYARDHRRLARGELRKDLHSFARCALLYTGLMPRRWYANDWGYWAPRRPRRRRDHAPRTMPRV